MVADTDVWLACLQDFIIDTSALGASMDGIPTTSNVYLKGYGNTRGKQDCLHTESTTEI